MVIKPPSSAGVRRLTTVHSGNCRPMRLISRSASRSGANRATLVRSLLKVHPMWECQNPRATAAGVARGFWHSHMGWTFNRDRTNVARFAPDLLADRDISRIGRQFPLWTVVSLLSPALLGGLITMTWWGALTAFFWAGLVRVAVLHHVTWSVNSICHIVGDQPWTHRDRSTNVWPLAIASMGESWHNLHHADPTCARHGVERRQIDMTARLIWMFEKLGWAHDVRWPTAKRLARLRA